MVVTSTRRTPQSPRAVCMDFSDMFCSSQPQEKHDKTPLPESPSATISGSNHKIMSPSVGTRKGNSVKNGRDASASCQSAGDSGDRLSTFAEWLHYTVEPNGGSWSLDPIQTKSGFQAMLAYQQKEQLRAQCQEIWNNEEMLLIRSKIHQLVHDRQIQIREDRDMCVDFSLRKQIMSLLRSYSIHWLILGLETVFEGESISISDDIPTPTLSNGIELQERTSQKPTKPTNPNSKRIQSAMQQFVTNRVLSDPKVLSKYTGGKCRVPSGSFETKFREEMRRLVLERLLMLFFFLDRARHSNKIPSMPRLFIKTSNVKSTRAILLAFCRNFLSKEGDFVKRLSRLGLNVHCRQEALDELDYRLNDPMDSNLFNGVLLARLTEVVTNVPFKSILFKLKFPATSREDRDYNIRHVCGVLQSHDVSLVDNSAIPAMVDGDRGTVLKLIRTVVSRHNLSQLVEEEEIRLEINRLQKSSSGYHQEDNTKRSSDKYKEGRVRLLLLLWCDAICSKYGVTVTNLTSDFADGVVVCLVLHYYMPGLIRLQDIQRTSRPCAFLKPKQNGDTKVTLYNERLNCKLANDKVSTLGRMGRVIPISDSQNLPDPKAVLLGLTYIFSQILTRSRQLRACIAVQRFFKRRRCLLDGLKAGVASRILLSWRQHRDQYFENQSSRYSDAVRVIELFFLNNYDKIVANKNREREIGQSERKSSTTSCDESRGSILWDTQDHPQDYLTPVPTPGEKNSSKGDQKGTMLRLWQDPSDTRPEEVRPASEVMTPKLPDRSVDDWGILSAFNTREARQIQKPSPDPGEEQPSSFASHWKNIKKEVAARTSAWQSLVSDWQHIQKESAGRDEAWQDLFGKWSSLKSSQKV